MRVAVIALLAGCSQLFGLEGPERAGRDDASVVDDDGAMLDDGMRADATDALGSGAWGNVEIAIPQTAIADDDPTLSADMLLMYFDRGGDIWTATRTDIADPWGIPTKQDELSSTDTETAAELNSTGLFVTVSSNRPSSQLQDIWWSLRTSRTAAWPALQLLPNVNSSSGDVTGNISGSRLEFVLSSNRTGGVGGYDLYLATRADTGSSTLFDPPTLITELSTAGDDYSPYMRPDGIELYFDRGGELYYSTRSGITWGAAMPITSLNTGANETDVWVSPDARDIYFVRDGVIHHASR